MDKPAPTDFPIHDLLARRWSPRAFADRPVEAAILHSLFEAARWAPSSYNEQPWRFLVATRDDEAGFARMLDCLVPFNQSWAGAAPVLVLGLADSQFARSGKPNAHAGHDLGQAAMSLSLEATERGLVLHQMAGIEAAKIRESYALPDEVEPLTAIALGWPGDPATLAEEMREAEAAPRERRAQAEFVFSGEWGSAAALG